jgi:hypothetical protein
LSYGTDLLETDKPCLYRCDFISCQVEPKSVDFSFGEVLAGSLTLRGILGQAWFKPSNKNILWLGEDGEILRPAEALDLAESRQGNSKKAEDNEWVDKEREIRAYHDEAGDWPPMLVFCLPILVVEERVLMGLLLATFGKEAFKRAGSFEHAHRKDFDHLPRCEITII